VAGRNDMPGHAVLITNRTNAQTRTANRNRGTK